MGLFSRTSQPDVESEDFDDTDLPTSTDINENPFANEPSLDFTVNEQTTTSKASYGIEDATRLMKALPRDNNEVVVTVVKKTLESLNIKVEDIINDANAKEERIRSQHKRLESEIKNLQAEITQRNQRISELLQDLKETTDVRQRLQLAQELDTGKDNAGKDKTAENTKHTVARGPAAASDSHPAARQKDSKAGATSRYNVTGKATGNPDKALDGTITTPRKPTEFPE